MVVRAVEVVAARGLRFSLWCVSSRPGKRRARGRAHEEGVVPLEDDALLRAGVGVGVGVRVGVGGWVGVGLGLGS